MYSYDLLETGCYYLVQEKDKEPITLIRPVVETDHCVYVMRYGDTLESFWKKKADKLFDIIECLSDEAVTAWEKQYNESEDAYYEDDEDV